ncbi:type VI secretion system Vgr family protein [Janthinobacterium fluminis]|uniref:Type VI secretion system tip protein TssI/VgrG n=1 Tax=Janthinobacterium fluminis TaxID=2987524 RepID=A0ABT5JWG2_9BURK|nr:type VI secretion system Vgr family protein [Janthinobacterium fluminis]MDC8757072.1 type VI secretion system tip protein TssI/VgrG [Janthinobacterium fluminis]
MDGSRVAEHMASLSALGQDSQHRRLLRMTFPRGGPGNAVMLVNTLRAREEMSRDFRFHVEVLSDDARIALKAMMARMVTVSMVRQDGSLRHFNGYVTEFRFNRTDGGFAFYDMVLEPWLALLRLRRDCVSFHGRSVMELTEATFAHYLQRDWQSCLYDDDPKLSCANQHNETDYNHLHRRWEALGLHYWYEHRADGHTLVIGDNTTMAEPTDGAGAMPFRHHAGSLEADGVHDWRAVRRIASGVVTLASFDYKNPYAQRASGHALNRQGDVDVHEVYENTGSYGYKDSGGGAALARRRMDEHDAAAQYFEAGGNDRGAQAGRSFRLDGHFSGEAAVPARGEAPRASIAARDYLILSVEHTASNNYQAGPGTGSHYENSFACIRKSVRWRPGRHFNSAPCADPGAQTATVVGPPGQEIYTDLYGRVRLQFHWDRIGKFDLDSSPWIRVMAPLAGSNFGQMALPRVGQEVLVQFLDGNVDHPIIVGGVYNNTHRPPWNLPEQLSLMGLRSRELESGARGNHLLLDDSKDAIQAQLRSDHLHSQLSLGSITRIDDAGGRKDARGEGFALETGGAGALRAAKGLLLSTDGRPRAVGGMLSRDELVGCLEQALDIAKGLGQAAAAHQGGKRQTAPQQELAGAVDALGHGAGKEAAAGQAASGQAVLAISGAAGIASATPRNQSHYAGQNIDTVAGNNQQHYAMGDILHTAAKNIEQFAVDGDVRLMSSQGKFIGQAQHNTMELTADKALTVTSIHDGVLIRAEKYLLLQVGSSFLHMTPEQITIDAKTLNLQSDAPSITAARGASTEMPKFDVGKAERQFTAHFAGDKSAVAADYNYKILLKDGQVIEGVTDANGQTALAQKDAIHIAELKFWKGKA